MVKREKSEYLIQAVDHALDLLEQFHDDVAELGVTELSKRLGLQKNNVFRILATLESRNFIEQNKITGHYRLGIKNLELGQTVIRQMGLLRQSRSVLEAVVKECNETTNVSILENFNIVYLDTVETDHAVRVLSRVGARLPAYCTAAGKIQLAYLSDKELDSSITGRELKKFTSTTITDREVLTSHLSRVAEQGFAVDDEELDTGVRCISSPIRDYTRRIIGAVSISGPTMRFSDDRIENQFIPLIRKAEEQISVKFGYQR